MHYGDFTRGLIQDCGFSPGDRAPELEVLAQSLSYLGIISSSNDFSAYTEISNWERGGGETYIACAKVLLKRDETNSPSEISFIAKAIVTFGLPLETVANEWIARRYKLQQHIEVPKLFAFHKGVFYEEFIPYSIQNILDNGFQNRQWLILEIAKISSVLDWLGFQPMNLMPNLRATKHKVYWVDFGADLGGPANISSTKSKKMSELELGLHGGEKEVFAEAYYRGLHLLKSGESKMKSQLQHNGGENFDGAFTGTNQT